MERMVGASGFEPPASWSRTRRASQAALRPEISYLAFDQFTLHHCEPQPAKQRFLTRVTKPISLRTFTIYFEAKTSSNAKIRPPNKRGIAAKFPALEPRLEDGRNAKGDGTRCGVIHFPG